MPDTYRADAAPSAAGAGRTRSPLRAPPALARRQGCATSKSTTYPTWDAGWSRLRILRDAERRHRAQARRGDAVLPRQPRSAHRRCRTAICFTSISAMAITQAARSGEKARRAVHRPRSLQERQRHARSPDRRRAAAAGRRALSRLPARERHRGAAGRRRVHRDDASGARPAGGRDMRAEAHRRAVLAVRGRAATSCSSPAASASSIYPGRCARRRRPCSRTPTSPCTGRRSRARTPTSSSRARRPRQPSST